MRIHRMISMSRRDFQAIYICEHCNRTVTKSGYDDANFHENVIPAMVCEGCGKTATEDYEPNTPRYPEGMQV